MRRAHSYPLACAILLAACGAEDYPGRQGAGQEQHGADATTDPVNEPTATPTATPVPTSAPTVTPTPLPTAGPPPPAACTLSQTEKTPLLAAKPEGFSPVALTSTGNALFWLNMPAQLTCSEPNRIHRVDLCTGAVTEIASDDDCTPGRAPQGSLSVVDGDLVWLTAASTEIRRVRLDGSDERTLVSGLRRPCALTVDPGAGEVFWIEQDDRSLMRAPLAGGTAVRLAVVESPLCQLALTPEAVFTIRTAKPYAVLRIGRTDGKVTALAEDSAGKGYSSLTFENGRLLTTRTDKKTFLQSIDPQSGAATTLATANLLSFNGILADGSKIHLVDELGLYSVPRSGGVILPLHLTTISPPVMAADAKAVYIPSGLGSTEAGLMRIPRN